MWTAEADFLIHHCLYVQAMASTEGAATEVAAVAALAQVEGLLSADAAPFGARLLAARARLLLQLRR